MSKQQSKGPTKPRVDVCNTAGFLWFALCRATLCAHVLHDVLVTELLEQADLTQSSAGDALVLHLQTNFLQGNNLACSALLRTVHDAVCAFAHWLVNLLVLLGE